MKSRLLMTLFALATLLPLVAHSATVTATCKDGTTFSGPSRSGACKGHQGVASWGEATPSGAAGSAATAATTQAPATSTTPATTPPKSTTAAAAQPPMSMKSTAPAAPGQVWVNSSSKVYHCAGSKWYGKTKSGKYMSEADAKAQGFHPVGGKACAS